VQLIAIDTNNCIDTVIQNVFIQPAPVAEISVSDPCELAPLEIIDNCSIADTFSIVTYSWNYGDNTSAINPSEDKIYESYGQYNVQLALEANNGCVDSIEQLITVHPKPVLGYDVGPACKNTWTSLENMSTIPEGSLTETNWLINLQYDFNQQNTAFKFPTLGIQLVNLESISDQ
ncbi:MAG: PKD domain-containing protein, partial [Crocinitomicaceae bacterium]